MADWFMGTSDLERSLLGTIFNGYNEDHVRADLKPRSSDSAVTTHRPHSMDPGGIGSEARNIYRGGTYSDRGGENGEDPRSD